MGKLHTNKNGFSAVEGLIVLVVLGLIAVAGWYVLHGKQKPATVQSQATQTQTTAQAKTVAYKNADYGFQFDYPKSWGTLTVTSTNGKTGKYVDLKWNSVTGRFQTRDYEPVTGTGVIVPKTTANCTAKSASNVWPVYQDEPTCINLVILGLPKGSGQGYGAEIAGSKKFSANAQVDGMLINFGLKDVPDASQATLKAAFSTAEQQQATDFMKSIQESK